MWNGVLSFSIITRWYFEGSDDYTMVFLGFRWSQNGILSFYLITQWYFEGSDDY